MLEMIATRDAYGETLVELGKQNPKVIVLDADLSGSTKTVKFAKAFPGRFFNAGVAEQNLIGMAAGLAACGKIVFASSFAIFLTGRAWEQIRNTVTSASLNVKVVSSHGGVSVGEDGLSHQSIEDISLMRSIAEMRVVVPADAKETARAIRAAVDLPGPIYVRLGRAKVPVVTDESQPFKIGAAATLKQGQDVTIIACGVMVSKALEASALLEKQGVGARVINMHTIKPIDREAVAEAARQTGAIVTAEEHSIVGGLGSAVCEVVAEECPVPVCRIGVQDVFGQSGSPEELFREYRLEAVDIVRAAAEALRKKAARP
ncbi:MAG TPA: transketolase family protein [bacterium]|nr:transketolase family protein [bacterium]